jgi:hypothetical protein
MLSCRSCRSVRIRAGAAVFAAVKSGRLPPLDGAIPCDDCGAEALHYDHRNYSEPLRVVPVCPSCNFARGRGIVGAKPEARRSRVVASRLCVRAHWLKGMGFCLDSTSDLMRVEPCRVLALLSRKPARGQVLKDEAKRKESAA